MNPDPSDDGLNRSAISNTVNHNNNNNEDNGDGDERDESDDSDSDAVDGPTIEAYVDLAKKACKYYFTRYRPIHIVALHLQGVKFILKQLLMKLNNPSFLISYGNLSTTSSILTTSLMPVSQTFPWFTAR